MPPPGRRRNGAYEDDQAGENLDGADEVHELLSVARHEVVDPGAVSDAALS
jgi:hypothetical protein